MIHSQICPMWQKCSVNDCPLTEGFSVDKNDPERACPLSAKKVQELKSSRAAINLPSAQRASVNSLIRKECCNFSGGNCVILDDGCLHNCPQVLSSELTCSWFIEAVLPLDPVLEAGIFPKEGKLKQCVECGKEFVPKSNRARYCEKCIRKVQRKQNSARQQKRRSLSRVRAKKPASVDSAKSQNLEGKGNCLTPLKSGASIFEKRGEAQ